MKKIISLSLVFIFSFTLISTSQQKKTEAVAIVGGYGIVQIIGMLLGGASLIGTGVVVGDLLDDPEQNNDFTDWLKNEYVEYMRKYQQLPGAPDPEPDKLTAMETTALISLLTEQGIRVGTDVYDMVKSFFSGSSSENNIPDNDSGTYIRDRTGYNLNISTSFGFGMSPDSSNQYRWNVTNNFGYMFKKVYLNVSQTDWFWASGYLAPGQYIMPTMSVITRDNNVITGVTGDWNAPLDIIYNDGFYTFNIKRTSNKQIIETHDYQANDVYVPVSDIPPVIDIDNLKEPENFSEMFKNIDLSPISGLVNNPQDMIDIISGEKQVSPNLYEKIKKGWNEVYEKYLTNPNLTSSPGNPIPPKVNPNTGLIDYTNLPDEPTLDPTNEPDELSALNKALYWLKGIWYGIRDLPKNIANEIGNIFQYLKNFIERFWQSFTEWWENNFLYHWTLFIDWLHTLPNLISDALKPLFDNLMIPVNALVSLLQNIWDWLQGFPDMLVGLIVPPDNAIAEVWEPVSDLFNQKIFPVIQPFQNIAFYEEELQDISADIKIGQYQGNHKIIDYSYLKSVREPIKSVIRSFFWILIIFFNLDQVHRLIRNQSIVKTYIRKVDEPGGNK